MVEFSTSFPFSEWSIPRKEFYINRGQKIIDTYRILVTCPIVTIFRGTSVWHGSSESIMSTYLILDSLGWSLGVVENSMRKLWRSAQKLAAKYFFFCFLFFWLGFQLGLRLKWNWMWEPFLMIAGHTCLRKTMGFEVAFKFYFLTWQIHEKKISSVKLQVGTRIIHRFISNKTFKIWNLVDQKNKTN